ncbi:hypothetical protein JCM8115_004195 [Rhodotorula mucilaginosa]|uniref:Uncharacterized protein n=1 Tax=Rhodotorula mucilaginosa TaxID=5537 RepID=A0A9P6VXF4_RHOMI|nr:hypothetical protein C6P46_007009 [Rhodotorula mucilaginosa]TKA50549.1 hypothetical protein B0A53_06040 [Rhodotorula sp. CCFEE 5036]
MRYLASLFALFALAFTLALAEPIPRAAPGAAAGELVGRRERMFGRPAGVLERDDPKRGQAGGRAGGASTDDAADATTNYLVTLDRSITNVSKDKILDVLLRLGAVVKQEYNYRVYKGILFTIPASSDKGLDSWSSALSAQDGVKYVEKDEVMRANSGEA